MNELFSTLPSIDAEFEVKPLFDDQTFTVLWEGLCDVSGRVGTSQLTGQAFVELSGY
ncbi:MAG: lipocalin family protein [Candidatus Hermodarchaeota archaeon]